MDYGYKFDHLKSEIAALSEKADALAQAYAEAEDFTSRFLAQCSKHKIKLVSIGIRTELIEASKEWPWDTSNNVFAEGSTRDGCPAIWVCCEAMGLSGCGNNDQHQTLGENAAKLIDGVYEYKDKKWNKIMR